ncbi:hypothetical protein GNI_026820 [Gregarina niphandrodes]|uniref:Uncharacterized protein n=1 Tax=Gregarina niphandrodes TaxID=110365 RepID=A0A023BBH1_GRENI|nr:hypothetical protein GNI_026820 [Gregarina niphandrodes]EZG79372.1 hypothetical protein GNI_026820 [Gregarina niphandrodes]|eukprot:XP_011129060.1 hypothetical protein GNI_026820 [Gregarina niphandrodes]
MVHKDWEDAILNFTSDPSDESFSKLSEALPFSSLCQYLTLAETSVPMVDLMMPVVEKAMELESAVAAYIVRPTMTRICELADEPILEPFVDGMDQFEVAEGYVGMVRSWSYSEYYPERRSILKKVLTYMLQVLGGTALCVPRYPRLQKGVERFGEWIAGLWLNMLDAEDTQVAMNMINLLQDFGAVQYVIPKAEHFSTVVGLRDFDDMLKRWHRRDLTADELDSVNLWKVSLPATLLSRCEGQATLLGDVDVSTCRVRAGICLIRIADSSPMLQAIADNENWLGVIHQHLYQSSDDLLKLTAAEVIMTELLESPWGCAALFRANMLHSILKEIHEPTLTELTRKAILRLVANVYERVPASRTVMERDEHAEAYFNHLKDRLLSGDDTPLAVSCVGSFASGLNPCGCHVIRQKLPEWRAVFLNLLTTGDEHEATATIMALLRMAAGIQRESTIVTTANSFDTVHAEPASLSSDLGLAAAQTDPEEVEAVDAVLKTIDEDMTPVLITVTYRKPWPTARVLIFKVFEALMVNHAKFEAAQLYASDPDLMEQLFNNPSDNVNEVMAAKHHYIKRLRLLYDRTTSPEFAECLEFCASHGVYDIPPMYQHGSRPPLGNCLARIVTVGIPEEEEGAPHVKPAQLVVLAPAEVWARFEQDVVGESSRDIVDESSGDARDIGQGLSSDLGSGDVGLGHVVVESSGDARDIEQGLSSDLGSGDVGLGHVVGESSRDIVDESSGDARDIEQGLSSGLGDVEQDLYNVLGFVKNVSRLAIYRSCDKSGAYTKHLVASAVKDDLLSMGLDRTHPLEYEVVCDEVCGVKLAARPAETSTNARLRVLAIAPPASEYVKKYLKDVPASWEKALQNSAVPLKEIDAKKYHRWVRNSRLKKAGCATGAVTAVVASGAAGFFFWRWFLSVLPGGTELPL